MTAAILALTLAASDEPVLYENYDNLSRIELVHQRRLLKENEPVVVAPIIVTCLSPIFVFVGLGLIVDGVSAFLNTHESSLFGGGFVVTVGGAGLIAGVVWLVKTAMAQKSVAARVQEIEALLDLGGYVPPPPFP